MCVRSSVAARTCASGTVPPVRAPGAADDRRAQVERVLHVARGMVRRHVERFEVVVVVLDLRALEDLVAHAAEDVLDLLAHPHQRMDAARGMLASGQRDVDAAGRRAAGFERGACARRARSRSPS